MIRSLAKHINGFKKDSILTPVFMLLEGSYGDGHPPVDGVHY